MAETVVVSSGDELAEALTTLDNNPLDSGGANELWDIWTDWTEAGHDHHLLHIPGWFSDNELDARRPFLFVKIEYDDDSKGTVLFDDCRIVDISIVENKVWDKVSMTQTLEMLDISEDDDHLDDPGMIWIPRSIYTMFERGDV